MTDGSGPGSSGRPTQYGGSVPRRLSYASVASGAGAGAISLNLAPTTRSGLFSPLTSTPNSSYPPQYSSDSPYQRRPSGPEQDPMSQTRWRRPSSLPSYSRKFANIPALGTSDMSQNAFFIPSYLSRSRYMARLEAAQKAKMRRDREQPSTGTNSLSTSAGNTNVHRMAPSHRGMTYDIIESNPPKEDEQLMPLPSRWSEQDKYPGLDVMSDGLDLKYSGSASKAEIEAASVRADFPMSPACGIYYFEVDIKHKSKDTAIAIGFSTAEASLERLPGWETHSWGYHGDDGKMFFGEHSGRSYGPTFGAGDIIGCGVNFNGGYAFFTKNGQDLGICFRELKKDIRPFPTLGMKKHSGALVTANFGQRPFLFDIDAKMAAEIDAVAADISSTAVTSLRRSADESSLIQELVAHFLAHDGYVETARAFAEEVEKEKDSLNNALPAATTTPSDKDGSDAVHRQRIRRAILSGDIDQALEVTHAQFPSVLDLNPNIVFRLKCRKWVELISKTTELNAKQSAGLPDLKPGNSFGKAPDAEDDFAHDMELDEHHHGVSDVNAAAKPETTANALRYDQLINEAMQYGQELQREYRDEEGQHAKTLQDIFSLVAYNDPKGSVHGHLLDASGRMTVAEELNSAILVSLGRSPSAALEKTWKQTESLIEILQQEGGPAAFVNLQQHFSGS